MIPVSDPRASYFSYRSEHAVAAAVMERTLYLGKRRHWKKNYAFAGCWLASVWERHGGHPHRPPGLRHGNGDEVITVSYRRATVAAIEAARPGPRGY